MASSRNPHSMETILNYDRDALSQWSEVWSTTHIPDMDNASGGATQRGPTGRRKLRFGSLALGGFLTMHCRVVSSVLTGGFFLFIVFLIVATVALANPMRHFEVYLGQWSISGPGRAFRVLPIFEGVGIAICINALVRAIVCCAIASIAGLYFLHSMSDMNLPYEYCRDFNLKPYDPVFKNIDVMMLTESKHPVVKLYDKGISTARTTVGTVNFAWRNASYQYQMELSPETNISSYKIYSKKVKVCNEKYTMGYPSIYSTPPYNFFYVEVVLFREEYNFGHFNVPLVICIILTWLVLWILLVAERVTHGRIVWNNTHPWLVVIPFIWTMTLMITAVTQFVSISEPAIFYNLYRIGSKDILTSLADALEVSLYIHSASVGTEIIHGKGLNHYASGHIDSQLNSENIWHSGLILLLCGLHASASMVCALIDSVQSDAVAYDMRESTLWIIPLYSRCTLINNYSHLASALVFGGLMFSYMTVSFILIKTALHTIFEYKVRLVFVDQFVMTGVILPCMGLSILFTNSAGVALLESVDTIMTGVATPFICVLELVALIYCYRSHDFISDMNVANEENTCSTRIGTQWQIIPAVALATVILKATLAWSAELPRAAAGAAGAALAAAAAAPALRAARNVFLYLRPSRPAL